MGLIFGDMLKMLGEVMWLGIEFFWEVIKKMGDLFCVFMQMFEEMNKLQLDLWFYMIVDD